MEQSRALQEQQNLTPERTNYLTKLKGKLLPEENKFLELKYSGKRIVEMTDEERWFSAQTILLKIHVITGWTIPISELMNILVDQFQQKILETYPNTTTKEFEYAFRNKGFDLKDWGKALNLGLIDEVMLPFLDNRFDLSMQEQKMREQIRLTEEQQKQLSEAKELTKEEWEEWLRSIMGYQFNLIPCDAYAYLEKTGEINLTLDEKHALMDRAVTFLAGTLDPNSLEGIEFARMKTQGVFSHEVSGTLKTYAKRYAVFDYFNKKNNEPTTTTN